MVLSPHTRPTRPRRRSVCHRHPTKPLTGLCALCLQDRLTVLQSSTHQTEIKQETIVSFPLSRRTRGYAGVAGASFSGDGSELRRSRSVAAEKDESFKDLGLDLGRRSCGDRYGDNKIMGLFDFDDTKRGRAVSVESKSLRVLSVVDPVLEAVQDFGDDCGEIKILDGSVVREDSGEIGEDEEVRTMKEHIEMELQSKKKNIWEAASVFSEKVRKWRQRHKEKKLSDNNNNNNSNDNRLSNRLSLSRFKDKEVGMQSDVVDYGLGRRSCDGAPRFSVDAHRLSVEDSKFSYDEHRASWDGYMVARTIPRLTPMLPMVDDMVFAPVNKRITVKEEGPSCGASAKSNSDSSSSNTGSSSSSMKSSTPSLKAAGLEGNCMKSVLRRNDVIGQETKLVITEKDLNDWHSVTNLESASNAPVSAKKTVKSGWRKMSNLWSYKYKLSDKKNGSYVHENGASFSQNNEIHGSDSGCKLVRNSSYVGSRNTTESHLNSQEGGRHSISDIESSLMRLHFSSFGKSRKKPAKSTATDG